MVINKFFFGRWCCNPRSAQVHFYLVDERGGDAFAVMGEERESRDGHYFYRKVRLRLRGSLLLIIRGSLLLIIIRGSRGNRKGYYQGR